MRFLLKVSEKIIIFVLVCAILTTSAFARITSLEPKEQDKMMSLIDNQTLTLCDKEQTVAFLEHFLYNSSFAAINGGIFPYPNSGEYTEIVEDGTYTVEGILAKGCFAYSKFVSNVMLGDFGTKHYHHETEGKLTTDEVRKFILKNVQSGEHVRIGTYHSVSFVSGDEKGFYSLGYTSDNAWGGQKTELVYYTYEQFTKELNKRSAEESANGRTLYVFDVQTDKNEKYNFSNPLRVFLDKNMLTFDVEPMLINDRTFVPLRAIAEAIGANVSWDEATNTAIIEKDGTKSEFTIDKNEYKINGCEYYTDAPAVGVGGRTLVPLRCVSESLNLDVKWEELSNSVALTTPIVEEIIPEHSEFDEF